ncbi:MAG: hypothetical protein ACK4N5_24120 [Myxococcales bacterium]
MMRGPLSPRVHGFLDYGAIALLFLAPMLFNFGAPASTILYVVAALYLGMVLLTAYPLGVAKVIPFTMHGWVEAGLALFFVVAPFLFGFGDVAAARNFFIGAGIALGGVFLLTDYKAAEQPGQIAFRRRSTV